MRIIAKTVNITMYPEKMFRLDDEDKEPEKEITINTDEIGRAFREASEVNTVDRVITPDQTHQAEYSVRQHL